MKVAVLTGGTSMERDVALASGLQITAALRTRGHSVHVVDLATGFVPPEQEAALLPGGVGREPPPAGQLRELERGMLSAGLGELPAIREAEVVFIALHGGVGEDGTVQAVLDVIGVPYTGSGHLASALAMDKDLAKRVVRDHALAVPAWMMGPPADADAVQRTVGYPCVVKPSKQGSSVGLTLVKRARDLPAALELAARFDDEVMVEQFISGPELTVGILGEEPLPVLEIRPQHEMFDYECKYQPGMTDEIVPAPIEPALAARVQEAAQRAHRALKLSGYSRIDFRLGPDATIFFLEANTAPGMTATSLIPKAARAAGMEFPAFAEAICALALARRGTKP
ncbi:MAG: D-alanine--D-alanine ligase [Gemmatimonadetes bacterium 21-71-4]|nr:MAG: D-alanine--D-alanine ligase [Gemmatimonadetes bacterium 21-71-4]